MPPSVCGVHAAPAHVLVPGGNFLPAAPWAAGAGRSEQYRGLAVLNNTGKENEQKREQFAFISLTRKAGRTVLQSQQCIPKDFS